MFITKQNAFFLLGGALLITAGITVGVYVYEQHQVINLNSQISSLKAANTAAAKKQADLSTQLNTVNQALITATTSTKFVEGATCQTPQLVLMVEKSLGGAAGSTGELFSYQNVSDSTCTVKGYPGFLALDSNGYVMPNGPVGHANAGNSTSPQLVSLAPQAKAYFLAYWPAHDSRGEQNGCVTTSVLESTPPTNLLPLTIATSLAPMCGTPTVTALGQLSDFE